MKLNICFFIDAFYPMIDGVINHVHNVANLLQRDHNVLVIAPRSFKKYHDQFPYTIYRVPSMHVLFTDYDLPLPRLVKTKLNSLLNNFKPDIIHVHSPFTLGKWGLTYASNHHIKSFITIHSKYKMDFLLRTKSPLITKIAFDKIIKTTKLTNNIISVCPNFQDPFLLDYKFTKENLIYLNNATNLKSIQVEEEQIIAFKKKHNLTEEFILLSVGRIDKIKNIPFIIEVLVYLKAVGFNFHCFFVGDGFYLKQLNKLIKQKHLTTHVSCLGKITDSNTLATIYHASNLFIFPSKYDTSGIVKQEAAAMQTPSIMLKGSTCAGGIIDNYNGYLAPDNVKEFGERIRTIATNPQTNDEVINNLKTIVNSWEKVVTELIALYQK